MCPNATETPHPHTSHAHADELACQAAHRARLAGASAAECAQVYARTYAAVVKG